MSRFNKITAIIGGRGSGKSLFTLGSKYTAKTEDKALNIPGLFDLYITHKKIKVLIVDTFDHPLYRNIPIMPMDKLHLWRSGIYRILIRPEAIAQFCKLLNNTNSIWNSAIFFEDAYKHTFKTVCKPMAELLGDTKQKNIDVFFMYWSYAMAPTDLYRLLDYIECFKTNDSPETRKGFMPGYFEHAMEVYNEVRKSDFKYYHKTIETGRE